jgi:hypothetical protein
VYGADWHATDSGRLWRRSAFGRRGNQRAGPERIGSAAGRSDAAGRSGAGCSVSRPEDSGRIHPDCFLFSGDCSRRTRSARSRSDHDEHGRNNRDRCRARAEPVGAVRENLS